jgi:hypothetical protein
MALTAAQLVSLACQDAAAQGYTSQGGQLLNAILQDLCETYNFDVAKGTTVFNFSPAIQTNPLLYPNVQPGGGPYTLPADFLRMVDEKDCTWYLQGVPYPMIPCDLSEYDNMVQQAGNQSYPYIFATDVSQSPANLLVWPPASGAYQCLIRYYRLMPDIATPETSATVPWFPNTRYLRTQLGAELMGITDDSRRNEWLERADAILQKYLKNKDDNSDRAITVKLDRRRFRNNFSRLPDTKTVGW